MKSIDMTIPRHTVIVLCGPTMCGKTNFVHDNFANGTFLRSKLSTLNSDNLRYDLLHANPHRHSPEMLSVSKQAFELLMTQLRARTGYPINHDYVVVDTRGFDENFRKQVRDVAVNNGYNTMLITFEYKDRSEYIPTDCTQAERVVVEGDVRRYLRKVLPTVRDRDWDFTLRIGSRSQEVMLRPDSEGYELSYARGEAVAIIGDSHECAEELEALVEKVEGRYGDNTVFVHVGDYLDKGGNTAGMVKAISDFLDTGRHHLITGNHENYVYKRLIGEIDANPELEAEHMTSLATLLADEDLAHTFKGVHALSIPYLRLTSPDSREIIVTHAPCKTKYLGKHTDAAMREQRNFRFKDREGDMREELCFLYEEAETIHPIHVFGHVAHSSRTPTFKNKIFLDTGAVHGGNLTAMVMCHGSYEFMHVACVQKHKNGVEVLPTHLTASADSLRGFNIDDYDLSQHDQRLLKNVMEKGVRYISGTMPPAPSSDNGLETLDAAFDYFSKHGVTEVVLQPKYMGSRCQMYLFRDSPESGFCVSRSGWVMKNVGGLDELLKAWHEEVFNKHGLEVFAESVILDGELLPWSALGRGLIDKSFVPYGELVDDELNTLAADDVFLSMRIGRDHEPMRRTIQLKGYQDALSLYAKDAPLEFKPFDILEIKGGETAHLNASQRFCQFNDDVQLVVNTESDTDLLLAKDFYTSLTVNDGMEGVVVKPLIHVDGVVPYMKVRSPEYLRLVYGYDYPTREEQLICQKNISGKASTAVREHRMAMQMLDADDDLRQELTVKLIAELQKESAFDPRL